MYCCTCLDFLLHTTICKHIHLVWALTNQDVNVRSEIESADLQYFKDILMHEDDEDSLQSLRIKTLSLVNDLYSSIYTCENQAAILSANKSKVLCNLFWRRRYQHWGWTSGMDSLCKMRCLGSQSVFTPATRTLWNLTLYMLWWINPWFSKLCRSISSSWFSPAAGKGLDVTFGAWRVKVGDNVLSLMACFLRKFNGSSPRPSRAKAVRSLWRSVHWDQHQRRGLWQSGRGGFPCGRRRQNHLCLLRAMGRSRIFPRPRASSWGSANWWAPSTTRT